MLMRSDARELDNARGVTSTARVKAAMRATMGWIAALGLMMSRARGAWATGEGARWADVEECSGMYARGMCALDSRGFGAGLASRGWGTRA